jgi:hypothetical protein
MPMEPVHYSPMDALLVRAQISLRESGHTVNYNDMVSAIYGPLLALEMQLQIGDSIELQTGLTLTVTFKPSGTLIVR